MGHEAGLKLLLIEDSRPDELLIRRRLARNLSEFELLRVDRAGDLKQALDQEWDAILYDYAVPGLDFQETVAVIRNAHPETPIVLVSGAIDEDTAAELLRHGIHDFLLKDRLARLPHAIHQAIDASRERRCLIGTRAALENFRLAAEHSPGAMVITDTTPRIEYINAAFERASGYTRDELIGRNPSILNRGLTPKSTYRELWAALRRGEVWHGVFQNTRKDGAAYTEEATIAPVRQSDGTVTHFVAIQSDVTQQRQAEQLIERLAYYDNITGLPNRVLLLKRMAKPMHSSNRQCSSGMALVLDLDGFKFINDMHGFDVGDRVLIEIAARIEDELADDRVLIARIGGNKFGVLVCTPDPDSKAVLEYARTLIDRLRRKVDQPFSALPESAANIRQSVSIGACLFSVGEPAEQVLSKAEIALHQAREQGRGQWRIFDPGLQRKMEARLKMESDLVVALERKQFGMHIQSVFSAEGHLVGAEALLRWQPEPDRFVPPSEFIPVAESSGLIEPIGNWVIEQAARRLGIWAGDPRTSNLKLSVNLSARQFFQPDLIARLNSLKERYQFDPSRMILELTESVFLENLELARSRMEQCGALGFGLALDDFGTGYSSLSYLNRLPFDTLKIDRSFVADMPTNPRSEEIVRATIALGHALKLTVVAEGVETVEQWEDLKALSCDFMQGYLFAKPVCEVEWKPADFGT